VVGSGISGLSAGWVLQRAADVTLDEADDRLGGHAHTHDVARATAAPLPVDSGFIVHNERTYPTLLRLFPPTCVCSSRYRDFTGPPAHCCARRRRRSNRRCVSSCPHTAGRTTCRRVWEFYLSYSEAGFRSRYLDVYQFVLARGEG
jgi:NAD(P)-binding Rossmann-like domain